MWQSSVDDDPSTDPMHRTIFATERQQKKVDDIGDNKVEYYKVQKRW